MMLPGHGNSSMLIQEYALTYFNHWFISVITIDSGTVYLIAAVLVHAVVTKSTTTIAVAEITVVKRLIVVKFKL